MSEYEYMQTVAFHSEMLGWFAATVDELLEAHAMSKSFLSLMHVRQSASVISYLKCVLSASIDSRFIIDTIWPLSSKCLPYMTVPSF